MERRRLGRTGLRVSAISLGTVELGLDYGIPDGSARPDGGEAERLLRHALDKGINFLDTARAYGDAEAIIGNALAGRRHEFVLCTKAQPGGRARITASVEESLRLLRTDAADILMLHCGAKVSEAQWESAGTMEELRAQGKVRFLGASVYGEASAMAAMELGVFDCLQVAHSAVDRRPEARLLPEAVRRDVGIVARSVLLKGALTHRASLLPPELAPLRDAAGRLAELARRHGIGLPELAYRYLLSLDPPHTLLAGTVRAAELDEVVAFAARGPLAAEIVAAIRAQPMPDAGLLNPGNWPVG